MGVSLASLLIIRLTPDMPNTLRLLSYCAALLLVSALANALFAADVVHLSSDHLDLSYDPDAGGITLRAPGGMPLVRNATAAVILGAGETSVPDRRYIR